MTVPPMPPPLRAWRDRQEARYPHAAAAIREAVEGLWEIEIALVRAQQRSAEERTTTARRAAVTLTTIAQERRRALRLVGQCLDEQLIGAFVALAVQAR